MNSLDYYGMKLPTGKSRSGWLVLFAILEALLALLFVFLTTALVAAQRTADGGNHVASSGLASATAIYAILSVSFTAGAVGTLLRRNWARVLMTAVSACWLGMGLLALLSVLAVRRSLVARPSQNTAAVNVALVALGIFMVLVPAIFLRFYTLSSVKATFQGLTRPLGPRLPVSIWIAAGLLILSADVAWCSSQFFPLFTFFGIVVTGVIARELMLLRAAVDAVLCAFFLKRDTKSWQVMVGLTVVFGVSNLVTNLVHTPQQIYAHVSWAHPERINSNSFWFSNSYRFGVASVITLAYLLLLLYTRRYFEPPEIESVPESAMSTSILGLR